MDSSLAGFVVPKPNFGVSALASMGFAEEADEAPNENVGGFAAAVPGGPCSWPTLNESGSPLPLPLPKLNEDGLPEVEAGVPGLALAPPNAS